MKSAQGTPATHMKVCSCPDLSGGLRIHFHGSKVRVDVLETPPQGRCLEHVVASLSMRTSETLGLGTGFTVYVAEVLLCSPR